MPSGRLAEGAVTKINTELARGDAATLPLQSRVIEPVALLEEVSQTAGLLHKASAQIVIQADVSTLQGDYDYLVQLLLNLLDNALRHTPVTGTVTLTAHTDGFTVTDTGPGPRHRSDHRRSPRRQAGNS